MHSRSVFSRIGVVPARQRGRTPAGHAVSSSGATGPQCTETERNCNCWHCNARFEGDPRSGVTPKWDFGVAMLPVGALCFYQAHFGRTVLPKWPFWKHLVYSVVYSFSELRRACFRQARVARAVLPPGALFRAGAFALPPCAPKSHLCPLPHLGPSEV